MHGDRFGQATHYRGIGLKAVGVFDGLVAVIHHRQHTGFDVTFNLNRHFDDG